MQSSVLNDRPLQKQETRVRNETRQVWFRDDGHYNQCFVREPLLVSLLIVSRETSCVIESRRKNMFLSLCWLYVSTNYWFLLLEPAFIGWLQLKYTHVFRLSPLSRMHKHTHTHTQTDTTRTNDFCIASNAKLAMLVVVAESKNKHDFYQMT